MKLPMLSLRTLLVFSALLLLPVHGYAQSFIDTERAKSKLILESQERLNTARETLNTREAATTKNDLAINEAKTLLDHANHELEELSRQVYYVPSEAGLARAESFKVLIDRYDALVNQMNDKTLDDDKRNHVQSERDALRKLVEDRAKTLDEQAKLDDALDARFRGFGFGIALGAVIDTGGRDRIESAILDPTGKVRVEKDSNTRANFMLESHYFFQPPWKFPFHWGPVGWVEKGNWGFGPFVAVQPGSSNLIDSVGVGGMIGFKRHKLFGGTAPLGVGDSFNIGVGALIDIKQRVLGDGIKPNQVLPAGETSIRYRETSQVGVVVIFSYSFY